ncbi:MAG: hypothetical protein LBT40_01765 [Deltaproteobacteria bacterium]|nr:hypothetical protein [Deltaproteobacteria bacterium]
MQDTGPFISDSLPPALRNVSMELVPAKGDAGDRRRIDVLLAVAGLLDETIADTADPARKERLLGRQDAVLRLPDETSLGQTLRLNRVHLAFNAAVVAFRDWIVTLLYTHGRFGEAPPTFPVPTPPGPRAGSPAPDWPPSPRPPRSLRFRGFPSPLPSCGPAAGAAGSPGLSP